MSLNTLRPRQKDAISQTTFSNAISLLKMYEFRFRRPGDKPLSEPMMVSLLTHICVTRPQWVKQYLFVKYIQKNRNMALLLFSFSCITNFVNPIWITSPYSSKLIASGQVKKLWGIMIFYGSWDARVWILATWYRFIVSMHNLNKTTNTTEYNKVWTSYTDLDTYNVR